MLGCEPLLLLKLELCHLHVLGKHSRMNCMQLDISSQITFILYVLLILGRNVVELESHLIQDPLVLELDGHRVCHSDADLLLDALLINHRLL